jgi:sugar lactone lactonase YvrE
MSDGDLSTLIGGLSFPEGPRWRDGRLFVSDFYTHRVLAIALDGRSEVVADVPNQPSGLGWMPDGSLLVVSMRDRRLLRLTGGVLRPVADLGALATGPCNDMVVDAAGRAYVGNFGYDRHAGESARSTCIVRVDPNGKAVSATDDLVFPNGMVITPDGRTLIAAETFADRLTAFDVAADGGLSNRRIFAALPGVAPDGICLDAEGAIWVADPRGKQVLRVFAGGKIVRQLWLGERGAYACMLGGADRRTLFICTNTGAGPGMTDKRDGRIEMLRVEVPGAGLP